MLLAADRWLLTAGRLSTVAGFVFAFASALAKRSARTFRSATAGSREGRASFVRSEDFLPRVHGWQWTARGGSASRSARAVWRFLRGNEPQRSSMPLPPARKFPYSLPTQTLPA